MDDPAAPDDLPMMVEAALDAGEIAMRFRQGPLGTRDKGDGQGPVTEADLAVDAMLKQRLRGIRPQYGWLSEETPDDPARLSHDRVFIVDPIDGTRGYANGGTDFCHAIAVAEKGRVIAAVAHFPALGLTYSASIGRGAWIGGDHLTPSKQKLADGARILAGKRQMTAPFWPGGVPDAKVELRGSLIYRLCLVAQGRFDASITFRPAWEWDVAVGDLILREAGARITTVSGEVPTFNSPSAKLPGIVAANAALHPDLMARLAAE
ncbi:myo-inositol-1(or 4)-monophosphatase [Rubricella aquisinus]|uniref:Myo-inositol-1(Or 4)-monophosphatase n=1 Tax=Rubricella aquisinus TaxID=2028108 RepID=A0A840X0M4_9RHOB|nr:myo-inositol-1(or 4)-monophosphatase [Rubricella aquisinus]